MKIDEKGFADALVDVTTDEVAVYRRGDKVIIDIRTQTPETLTNHLKTAIEAAPTAEVQVRFCSELRNDQDKALTLSLNFSPVH